MRLLLVIPKIVSYRSFLRTLCMSLVADGDEVHIACSHGKAGDDEVGSEDQRVRIHRIDFPRGMNPAAHLKAARALNRLVKKLQPDIVHAHFSAAIFTAAVARNSCWPVTHATFHGVSFPAMKGWKSVLLRAAETWAARRFDIAWVLTGDDRKSLEAASRNATVRRLPGFGVGCDLKRFSPVPTASRDAIRTKVGISTGEIVFAFVGRFTDFKGFGLVVRSFLRIAGGNPNLRLLLVGARDSLHATGLDEEEERLLRTSAQIIDAGYRHDVENCLAAADIVVFPSRREGMPVCLMESLAMGIPVITLDSRGCRDVVRDGIDGRVLPDSKIETISAAMTCAAGDQSLRRRWSEEALSGRGRFSRDNFVAEQKAIYRSTAISVEKGALARA